MKTWSIEDFPLRSWNLPTKPLPYQGKWVYNWFSNFVPSPMIIGGLEYGSVENWYQANKVLYPADYERIRTAPISKSKQLGKSITIRPDWEQVKFDVMFKGLLAKCEQHPDFLKFLKDWSDELVEWNNWSDKIWGTTINDQIGRNALGIMLNYIRNDK